MDHIETLRRIDPGIWRKWSSISQRGRQFFEREARAKNVGTGEKGRSENTDPFSLRFIHVKYAQLFERK